MHGDNDQTVPVEDAFLFDKSVNLHTLAIIGGGDHNFRGCKAELLAHVIPFLLSAN